MKFFLFINSFVLLFLFFGCNNQKKVQTDNKLELFPAEKSEFVIIHTELLNNFEALLRNSRNGEENNIFILNFYQEKDEYFLMIGNGIYIDYQAILNMPFIGYQKYNNSYILIVSDFSDELLKIFINISELNNNIDDLKVLMPPEEDVITHDPEVFLYKIDNQNNLILVKPFT